MWIPSDFSSHGTMSQLLPKICSRRTSLVSGISISVIRAFQLIQAMDAYRAIFTGLVAVRTVAALTATAADVAPTSSLDNLRGSRHLQHVADNGRSESFDDGIDADVHVIKNDINPDSGDEDYSVQDWVEDPFDDSLGADSIAPYDHTAWQWNYDGPLLSEAGNGLPPGSLNVCEGDW